jgi:membrane-bound inhibitor of C-type lysozyme
MRLVAIAGAVVAASVAVGAALAADPISVVDYACAGGKTIVATYWGDKVDLVLSDGRKLSLPQTMSGSGIRYADADEAVVFWSKGDGAFITEGKDPYNATYDNCAGKTQ